MINFLTQLPNRVLFSANNAIVRFELQSGTPLKATIGNSDFTAVVYPDANGVFYFNFYFYLLALANKNNYQDTLQTDLPTTINYAGVNFYFLSALITIERTDTTLATATVERLVIAGAQQLMDENIQTDKDFILAPCKTINYWQGYPFDISYYNFIKSDFDDFKARVLNDSGTFEAESCLNFQIISNNANPSLAFLPLPFVNSNFQRVIFSDGQNSIDNTLEIVNGENNLKFTFSNFGNEINFNVIKDQNPCQGVYLKWFWNGAYLYWLFPKYYQLERTSSNTQEYEGRFENLEQSFGSVTQFGKESRDTISLNAELLNPCNVKHLATLFDSPAVFLYKGKAGQKATEFDWIEVRVDNTTNILREWKDRPITFNFSITLPPNETLRK